MKILYAVSESYPFSKNGGLGDVSKTYPRVIHDLGADIRMILPLYDTVPDQYRARMELLCNFTLSLSYQDLYCGLYLLVHKGVPCYFIENDCYFSRGKIYGCEDDDARFAFFCKAVCESIRHLGWTPEIVHCNDWQTALIPFYLRDAALRNPAAAPIRTLFTIHNVEYQGSFRYSTLTDVFGLSGILFAEGTMELDGHVNLMKGAIEISDCITTVSPSYAEEISAPDSGYALSSAIRRHRGKLHGILNGISDHLGPMDSPYVHRPYDQDSLDEKVFNKLWMQEARHLTVSEAAPVLGCVSRLLPRKGFELLVKALPPLLRDGAELLVTGDGKPEIRALLKDLQQAFPSQVSVVPYSEAAAAEVFSSADLFLMPSLAEPCGMAQMIAMRYGTVPVVRNTGGLRDTVENYNPATGCGFGFQFDAYTPEALRGALDRALAAYENGALWETLQRRCMEQDFRWDPSAKRYLALYENLLESRADLRVSPS